MTEIAHALHGASPWLAPAAIAVFNIGCICALALVVAAGQRRRIESAALTRQGTAT